MVNKQVTVSFNNSKIEYLYFFFILVIVAAQMQLWITQTAAQRRSWQNFEYARTG